MFAFLHRCGHKFGLSVNVATTTSLPLPLCSSRLGKAHLKLTFHQPSGSRTNRDADINSGPKHREMVARAIGRGYAQPVDGLFAIPVFEVGRVDLFRQQKQVFGGGSETSAIEVLQRSATGGGGAMAGPDSPSVLLINFSTRSEVIKILGATRAWKYASAHGIPSVFSNFLRILAKPVRFRLSARFQFQFQVQVPSASGWVNVRTSTFRA